MYICSLVPRLFIKMLTSTALELAVYQSDFRTVQVTVVEFQVHPSQYNEYTASTWNNGSFYSFVYNYYRQNSFFTGKDLFESSSVLVLVVLTVSLAYRHW